MKFKGKKSFVKKFFEYKRFLQKYMKHDQISFHSEKTNLTLLD